MIEIDLRCSNCTGFLNVKAVHSMIAQVRCPKSKCKHLNNIKVVSSDSSDQDRKYKFKELKV